MGGADVEVAAVLGKAQTAGIKGDVGIGAAEACGSDPLPVLGVGDHPHDLGIVTFS